MQVGVCMTIHVAREPKQLATLLASLGTAVLDLRSLEYDVQRELLTVDLWRECCDCPPVTKRRLCVLEITKWPYRKLTLRASSVSTKEVRGDRMLYFPTLQRFAAVPVPRGFTVTMECTGVRLSWTSRTIDVELHESDEACSDFEPGAVTVALRLPWQASRRVQRVERDNG
jgi:hypothetical protein